MAAHPKEIRQVGCPGAQAPMVKSADSLTIPSSSKAHAVTILPGAVTAGAASLSRGARGHRFMGIAMKTPIPGAHDVVIRRQH
jgi:hypothetical protein